MLLGVSMPLIAQESASPIFVSMVELLANPDKYHQKLVRIVGYVWIETEGAALYLHREDKINSLTKNAIQLSVSEKMLVNKKQISGHYVLVEGVFDSSDNGHMGLYSGTLRSIQRASPRLVQR